MDTILKNSSNRLHFRAKSKFEDLGWTSTISSYFYDDTTDKPREIDIIAHKTFPIPNTNGEERISNIHACLFIECKWFSSEIYFWLDNNSKEKAKKAIFIEGLNLDEIFQETNLLDMHHYSSISRVAKLYDTQKDQENNIFDAVTKPVKTLIFHRQLKDFNQKYLFYYPVIIYGGQDGFYLIENEKQILDEANKTNLKFTKNIIFNLNYTYRQNNGVFKNQEFFIDIVNEKEIDKLIHRIELEISKVVDHLSSKRDVSKQTIKEQINPAR